ncbi:hypothetical protein CIT292_09753 [Citrobacter youngae ATCC 29220]|uniref:Uncharacterized protein n=1 Tax=Citrobacter youngae ATCC 29220 TaxID=500640 RepID=D4BGU8_9ENTR|nr:hypothetical protein CIT292_09753 [Citrobacter youngae ATCC 29220]
MKCVCIPQRKFCAKNNPECVVFVHFHPKNVIKVKKGLHENISRV